MPAPKSSKAQVPGSDKPTKQVPVSVTPEEHLKFKTYAAKQGRSMVDIVRELIRPFIIAETGAPSDKSDKNGGG